MALPWMRMVKLGLKSLALHKLRSALTTLGMLFGVSSVIAMLSIGEGASYEAQKQIEQLGSNNILIRAQKPPEDQSAAATRSRIVDYGLTYDDAERVQATVPGVKVIVPVRDVRKDVRFRDLRSDGRILGTVPWFASISNYPVSRGRFLAAVDVLSHANVCVLGNAIAKELFIVDDPIGSIIKVGTDCFTVVGVMEPRTVTREGGASSEEFGHDVYIPISTARNFFGEVSVKVSSGSREMEHVELHQIQVSVDSMDQVAPAAAVIRDMLKRFHKRVDYDVVVPLELLRRAEDTKRMFNIVLGSIAGISLLVGGIGIMNVMLASVTERTREIGIRRALGAKRRHIVSQFLVETVVLSASGGLLGLLLGIGIPFLVTLFAGMKTIITPISLVMAFGISGAVGVIFGLYPAWRAAHMDPVEALRHE
jgi:putative ABC transport system permease protein